MTNKFYIAIGAAFLLVFVSAIAAVVSINRVTQSPTTPIQPVVAKSTETPVPVASNSATAVQTPEQPAEVILTAPVAASPQTASTTPMPVADSDLLKLAAAVNLGGTNVVGVNKEVWARETPIAQKLLQGLCDCDQRNWLTHFVKTGNEALSGSENYYQSVQLLATLRRNDQELGANGATH